MPTVNAPDAMALEGGLHALDWVVLVGYVVGVSWLGVWLAGKPASMRDFFRGGDKLPWYAVSASIIATTISAVTFVGVPAIAFDPGGGNLTYLQLGLIAGLLSRLIVGYVLVPAYYERRVYSPYDYMAQRLGPEARTVTTALFTVGGVLAQSARVYLTALVLQLVLHGPLLGLEQVTGLPPFASAVLIIGAIAVAWTLLGGIATVVWTDALLFLVFVAGGIGALGVILSRLDGGLGEFLRVGHEAGKFKTFDLDQAFSLTEPYTLAAAGFAVVVMNVGVYGTDQLLAQRIFCCRDAKEARKAVLSSYAGEAVAALMLLVGVGLYVFYVAHPEALGPAEAAMVARENDKIFPVFILKEIPIGLAGLVIAGIFAAAISSLTSILAALAQTSVSAVYLPWRGRRLGLADADEESLCEHDAREGRRLIGVSRWFIVGWGVVLCGAAFGVAAYKESTAVPILDLALGLASYIVGGLFAAFLLAWLPIRINGRGLLWAAPLGVLVVFATRFHERWAQIACAIACGVLLLTWIIGVWRSVEAAARRRRAWQTLYLVLGLAVVGVTVRHVHFTVRDEAGRPVRLAVPQLDDRGAVLADPRPRAVALRHPISGEPLHAADGAPLLRGYAKRTADGRTLTDAAGQPRVQSDWPPVLWSDATGPVVTRSIAWPWYAPIGGGVSLLWGYLLADPRRRSGSSCQTPAP